VTDTPIFVQTSAFNRTLAGSIVLNNAKLTNVDIVVGSITGHVILEGCPKTTKTVESWGQGNVYKSVLPIGKYTQGNIHAAHKSAVLLDDQGRIFGKTHPQYADYAVSQFVSVRDYGAKGDGKTDDTAAIQAVLEEVCCVHATWYLIIDGVLQYASCKIIFFDAGTYIVSSTITIPAGARIVGEAWSVMAGKGKAFQDQNNPQVVVRVGEKGSQGVTEITDIIFSTVGSSNYSLLDHLFSYADTVLKRLVQLLWNGTSRNRADRRVVLECGIHISGSFF